MSQNLDRNKLTDSIKKVKPQNLLYLTINSKDKDSLKNALTQVQMFIGKKSGEIVLIK
jgi:hypothetical protein